MKKKHFNIEQKSGNVYDDIEWMRINAERERIAKYKVIAQDSALFYYKILKKFTEETQRIDREKTVDKNNSYEDP
jgi:hypothetical protein